MTDMSISDVLALQRRDRDDYRDCRNHGKGMAATGIGLAAGLGGGALLLGIAGLWGINQASKARSHAADVAAAGNTKAIELVAATLRDERQSRESWQLGNAPSIRQYVDVQANPSAGAGAGAGAGAYSLSMAEAIAAAINNQNNNGISSAIGHDSFLRVQRYSAPQPCGCDTCGCGN